jgi:ubiquinone/menaquinone biosynthesis C-methylase UbiE
MSNAAYHDFVQRILERTHIAGKEILRVGSPDLDSPLRAMANAYGAASYVGIDIELGPNVGKLCHVEHLLENLRPESCDLLICCEWLQHVENWPLVISIFKRVIRPHGSILVTTRSLALPTPPFPHALIDFPHSAIHPAPEDTDPEKPTIFREHALAHALLDGLSGLEIGAAAHNPFGLRTRNVALPEGHEFYADHQRREMDVEPVPVDIWASADHIPAPDASEDFILSSHVIEHLPNVIATFVEWDRIVRDGGYVFVIVPLKGALPADASRELTPLAHFVEDCYLRRGQDTTIRLHPIHCWKSPSGCVSTDFASGSWWHARILIARWETDSPWPSA